MVCVLFFCYIMYIYTDTFLPSGIVEGQEIHMGEGRRGSGRSRRKNNPQYFRGPVIGFSFADAAWEHSHLCTHNDDENHLTNRGL